MSAVLGEFVSEVSTLKKSGQLGSTTAARLERAARATAAGAASRLHPSATHPAATASTGLNGSQTSTAADPATSTASASTPSQSSSSDAGPAQQGSDPALPADAKKEKQKSCGSPWSGHHQHEGRGLGHGGFGNPKCQGGDYGWSSGGNNWQGAGGG